MYEHIESIKKHVYRTVIDDFEDKEIQMVINLLKTDKSKFIGMALRNEVKRFHSVNSIGKGDKQTELFKEVKGY